MDPIRFAPLEPLAFQIQEPTPFAKMIGERVDAAITDLHRQRERFLADHADLAATHTLVQYPVNFMRSSGDDESVRLTATQLVVLVPTAMAEDPDFSMPPMEVVASDYPHAEFTA